MAIGTDNPVARRYFDKFGHDKFDDDKYVFKIVNLSLPDHQQLGIPVVGEQASALLRHGHYHVELIGENKTSKEQIASDLTDNIREDFHPGDFERPQFDEAEQLQKDNDSLRNEIAALKSKFANQEARRAVQEPDLDEEARLKADGVSNMPSHNSTQALPKNTVEVDNNAPELSSQPGQIDATPGAHTPDEEQHIDTLHTGFGEIAESTEDPKDNEGEHE